ncbi:MAG: hypothetical protein E5X34_13165 [Mesorhizobium sp.]|uniref:HEPN domain-containing protein n=1 Tax=Mesorhizobium sp. TaxID=1871066 RepID=UPI00121F8FF5|nr:MAE_28990/MAE_18760 family HEPN-like nuclease [Mesorhizobium sp.]TIR23999.1 MAG: hypothetical protein E5X34_13165 [Mesorhizobium sp.]
MYNAFLKRTKEAIAALEKHIRTSDQFRTAVFNESVKCKRKKTPCFDPAIMSPETAPDLLQWRVIDHCAAVTRIYAIYEQFAHEMIREHLSLLQSRIPFGELPDSLRSSYRTGIAKILEKKDGPRFADLDLATLISGYDRALGGHEYVLEPRAMLMQEQNLRLPELQRFMSACGVDGVAHWIEQHPAIQSFFAVGGRLTATAASEMAELIEYRNDAAHGSIDITDIQNVNGLTEFCHFVAAVCEALAEKVQLAGLRMLQPHDQAAERGWVAQSLKKGLVAIGRMTGSFRIGDTVYLCGEAYCHERAVVSLQLDGVAQDEVNLAVATELGIQFDAPGKRNATVMVINPRPARSDRIKTEDNTPD